MQNGNGSIGTNFFQNLFTGQLLHAERPKRRSVPALEKKRIIESGKNFSQIKIYVHTPTLQYPETSIFLQLSNAKGSCFMRLDDSSILTDLSQWLQEVSIEVETTVSNLEPIRMQVEAQLNQYAQNLEMLRQAQSLQYQDGDHQGVI